MEEKPNYYAVIPSNVRYDDRLKDKAKLLYGEITALSSKDGYCYATNKYFADLYKVSTTTISTLIKNLIECGYLESEIIYKEGTKEILNRYLKIFKEGIKENLKDNNTSINNTSINNKKEIYKEKRFKKPTLEEIEEYCKQRNSSVNPKTFYEYFETGGWVDSKGNKVKNWKQKIITWEGNRKKETVETPVWLEENINKKEITKEEKKEMEDILNVFD